jgi:hypothetical protein
MTKLRVASEEWCIESGKQKGRKYSEISYQTTENLDSTDSSFEENLLSQ